MAEYMGAVIAYPLKYESKQLELWWSKCIDDRIYIIKTMTYIENEVAETCNSEDKFIGKKLAIFIGFF